MAKDAKPKKDDGNGEPEIAGKKVVKIENWVCPICQSTYGNEADRNVCWQAHAMGLGDS